MNRLLKKGLEALSRTPWGRYAIRRGEMALASRPERRILGVWWFQAMSGSLGDSIVFHENLLCLMHEYGFSKVDVAFVDDPSHPNNRHIRFQLGDNWKDNVIAMNCVNPHVGSVFRFGSKKEYLHFIHQNRNRYLVFPFLRDNGDMGYDERLASLHCERPEKNALGDFDIPRLGYEMRFINDFFDRYGFVPRQSCRTEALARVREFLTKEIYPAQSVVIQIRSNPVRQPYRNVDMDSWLEVVESNEDNSALRFIAIGTPAELSDPRLNQPNLIRSKDHFNSIEEDLALIQCSHAAILNLGGLMPFGVFAGVPCLMFGADMLQTVPVQGYKPNGSLGCATEFQRLFWGKPTTELLLKEFNKLMADLGSRHLEKSQNQS